MNKILLAALLGMITFSSCTRQVKNTQESAITNDQPTYSYLGKYSGTLPCADCSGIITVLELTDSQYTLTLTYEGRGDEPFEKEGGYNIDGNILMLDYKTEKPTKYIIGDNYLKLLDEDGKEIEGSLSEMYILKKI